MYHAALFININSLFSSINSSMTKTLFNPYIKAHEHKANNIQTPIYKKETQKEKL